MSPFVKWVDLYSNSYVLSLRNFHNFSFCVNLLQSKVLENVKK